MSRILYQNFLRSSELIHDGRNCNFSEEKSAVPISSRVLEGFKIGNFGLSVASVIENTI